MWDYILLALGVLVLISVLLGLAFRPSYHKDLYDGNDMCAHVAQESSHELVQTHVPVVVVRPRHCKDNASRKKQKRRNKKRNRNAN